MRPPAAVTPNRSNDRARHHGGLAGMLRVLAVGLVLLVGGSIMTVPAVAQTPDDAAQQAAREIQEARDRANAAADAFFEAQSDLESLEDEVDQLEDEIAVMQLRVDRLRRDVESLAVARFATSGTEGIPLLTGLQAPKDQVQAEVFVDVVTDAGSSTLDEYALAQKELATNRTKLDDRRDEIEERQETFTRLQDEAADEVERLREIEEQRLTDEAVQRALEAQQAASLSKWIEAQRLNDEAAKRAQPNPGVAAAEAAVAAQQAADAAADGTTDGSVPVPIDGAPTSTVAPNTGASGGASGGRTGIGGAGSSPSAIIDGTIYVDAIMCPMTGAAYGDSWGAPRSGGRRHEGVDMLAPAGTPIYAVTSGYATFKQNRLGGNAVSLAGDNGNRYYYAHLSAYEGASRRVEPGDVIGYNGDTGNATGIPHLHFEVHPGGGLSVNPTPTVRAAGC